jgi:hypothetical protein
MVMRRQEKELIQIEVYRNQSIGICNTVYSTEYPLLRFKERSKPAYSPVQALAALKLARSSQQLK